MSETKPHVAPSAAYRVNSFVVPAESRAEFLDLIEQTHAVVRDHDGLVRDLILERQSGTGSFDFVTLLEFRSAEVLPRIGAAIAEADRVAGLDRGAISARLGVRSDMSLYQQLA